MGVFVVVVGAGAALLARIASQPCTGAQTTIGLIAAGAVAALVYRILVPQIEPLFGPAAKGKVAEAVEKEPGDPHVEQAFREALRERLVPERRRAVVIDDLGNLRAHP